MNTIGRNKDKLHMKYYWLIRALDNENSSSDKYITDTLEDAEAHRMEYCGWYCQLGDVIIRKVDQNFREIERLEYFKGKVVEHKINIFDEENRLVKTIYSVKNGKKARS